MLNRIQFLILATTILSCKCLENCQAQNPHDKKFSLSAGYIRFEKDALNGIYFSNEFANSVSKRISISTSLDFGHGTTGSEYPYSLFNKTSASGNIIAKFSVFKLPISQNKYYINVGVGPSLRYFSGPSISDYKIYKDATITIGPHLDQSVPLFHPNEILRSHNYFAVGGRFALEVGMRIFPRGSAGITLGYGKYTRGGNVVNSGIIFSYNLK